MSQRKRAPHDDTDLFRQAVKDVAPLRDQRRVRHPVERPSPLPLQRIEDDRQVLQESLSDQVEPGADIESGDAISFVRDGMSPQVLRRLRAGFWAIQQEIDLHGLRLDEARARLVEFLNAAVRHGARCVRVIHGKGRRSKNGEPVLKPRVAAWLIQRGDVLAFCEARAHDGGSGAMLVLLRGSKQAAAQPPDDEHGC